MQNISFNDLPEHYISLKNQIQNEVIKKIYSEISFLYLPLYIASMKQEKSSIEHDLFNYLREYKLITYYYTNIDDGSSQISGKYNKIPTENNDHSKLNQNSFHQIVDAIICVEKKCIIIEKIDFELIKDIIDKLEKQQTTAINVTEEVITYHIREEIDNFMEYFRMKVINNSFYQVTIRPISGFLIRRFFYPTNYFKDPSFFTYKQTNNMNEEKLKQEIKSIYESNMLYINKFENNLNKIVIKIEAENDEIQNKKVKYTDFLEKDFIPLRIIHSDRGIILKLVIHIESLHIFMMKKTFFQEESREMRHEIDYCENYSHRCLMKFYGFLKNKQKIVGFIYEYLSNGSLKTIIKNDKFQKDDLFKLFIVNRIFQGINYLHSNSLIHRDIKPSNILFNHDFLPFISDFETVRLTFDTDNQIKNQREMTGNIGTDFYSSPEQDRGYQLSFSTDIYSFGLTLYFLYNNKDFLSEYSKEEEEIPEINNNLADFRYLFQSCIRFNPDKRIKNQEIKDEIIAKINSFFNIEKYINEEICNFNIVDVINFIIEGIYIQIGNNHEKLIKFYEKIVIILLFIQKVSLEIIHEFYLFLGSIYFHGFGIEQNYSKAVKYYEMAAKQNNSRALFNLGNMYFYGKGVKHNISKAIEYFELSAKLNNSDSLYNLWIIYYKGYGVERNIPRALTYLKLSASLNNSYALLYLGNHYFKGEGVEKDLSKSFKYFNLSAREGNSDAILTIGFLFFNGYGVTQNYILAIEMFKISAQLENPVALFILGQIYSKGIGVNKDYSKALEYYKEAARQGNSDAFRKLGNFYLNGKGIEKNYSKALEYYKEAIRQGNSDAFRILGDIYFNGKGVEKDYKKAIYYYELFAKSNYEVSSYIVNNQKFKNEGFEQKYLKTLEINEKYAKLNRSNVLFNLGNLYTAGILVPKDYLKAKKYYEMSSEQGNSFSTLQLGHFYMYGKGVEKNSSKALEYYKLSAEQNNLEAFLCLGKLYSKGKVVEKNNLKAHHYIKLAAIQNHPKALYLLGNFYFNNNEIVNNYSKARYYYELSAKQNFTSALFALGQLYSNGIYVDSDISKAIKYLIKCSEIHDQNIPFQQITKQYWLSFLDYNHFYYRAFNDLGLIYLMLFEDFDKGIEYIKKSAFGEYPFGQNNFGLSCQFYLNEIGKAKHFYKRSSEHKFSLAEYNLGYMKEKENQISESIEYYIKASEHENEPLMFQNNSHEDYNLEISKIFIMCLVNLKLASFYLKESNYCESKKFFIKSLSKIIHINMHYKNPFVLPLIKNNTKNIFEYLKIYIILNPIFLIEFKNHSNILNFLFDNLNNEDKCDPTSDTVTKLEDSAKKNSYDILKNIKNAKMKIKMKKCKDETEKFKKGRKIIENQNESIIFDEENEEIKYFTDLGELFDFVIKDKTFRNLFIEKIDDITSTMETILHLPPYLILFGRIHIIKSKQDITNPFMKNINEIFYEGFGLDLDEI